MITGTIMGEMKKTSKVFFPGKIPLTKARETIDPMMRESNVLRSANLMLNNAGVVQSSDARNAWYQLRVKPLGGKTKNLVSLMDMGTVMRVGTTK
jgi:hypothetical protein